MSYMKALWFACEDHQWLSDQMMPCPWCRALRDKAVERAAELEWEGPTDAEIYQAVHVYNKEN